MKLKIKIFIGVALVLMIGLIAGIYLYNKKVPGLKFVRADYSVTADALYDAFEIDETEAMIMYENKVIEVTGEVTNIETKDNKSTVTLKAENAMAGGVNCSFNSPVEGLNKGDRITIKGRCQGFLMDVILNNCTKE